MERIGDYLIEGQLGSGGTATVFRARRSLDDRLLAIKVLTLTAGTSEIVRKRFEREMQVVARLSHPHIVGVHDVGQVKGRPYLVMDFAPSDLDARLSKGPLAPALAAGIARKLALGLQHAHEQGIVHRDVKPGNVLFSADGEPMLADFGLVKDLLAPDEAGLSKTGMFMGTPGYWAPEQARGRLHLVDHRVDVYGLGATLYGALTLRPPIEAVTMLDMLEATSNRRPEPPSDRNPRVDANLDAIVLKCLEKDRADRYASAEELAEDLDRYLRGQPVEARAVRRAAPVAPLAVGAAAVLLLGGGTLAAFSGPSAAPPAPPAAPPEVVETEPVPEPVTVAEDPGPPRGHTPRPEALAIFHLGLAHMGTGDMQKAITRFAEAEAADPNYVDPVLTRGTSLALIGESAAALRAINAALKLDPDQPKGYVNRANIRLEDGDTQGALEDYARALELLPDDPLVLNNRGYCYLRMRRFDDALRDFNRAIEVDPEHTITYANRGMLYMELGEETAAMRDFDLAVRLEPRDWTAWVNRGLCAFQFEHYEQALRDFESARDLAPNDPEQLRVLDYRIRTCRAALEARR